MFQGCNGYDPKSKMTLVKFSTRMLQANSYRAKQRKVESWHSLSVSNSFFNP